MSWEWTNRDAANRHLELPGIKAGEYTRRVSNAALANAALV